MTTLTGDLIEQAFDALGREAARLGIVAEIAVYGGSCIMLASDIRDATGDVDAVFLDHRDFLYDAGRRVGARLGLPEDWLNQAVRRVAPPPGGADPNLIAFGDYPRDGQGATGLRVFLPTPAYLLAMKLLANRGEDDPDKTQSDMRDLLGLMRITGIETYDAMAGLLRECYPHLPGMQAPTLTARLDAKMRSVLDAYGSLSDTPDPTWHAGRGPATRPR